jgi:hypothetical protein
LWHRIRGKKEIEVLGITPNARMLLQRECARDHVRDLRVIHVPQHIAKQRSLLRRKVRLNRRAYG